MGLDLFVQAALAGRLFLFPIQRFAFHNVVGGGQEGGRRRGGCRAIFAVGGMGSAFVQSSNTALSVFGASKPGRAAGGEAEAVISRFGTEAQADLHVRARWCVAQL